MRSTGSSVGSGTCTVLPPWHTGVLQSCGISPGPRGGSAAAGVMLAAAERVTVALAPVARERCAPARAGGGPSGAAPHEQPFASGTPHAPQLTAQPLPSGGEPQCQPALITPMPGLLVITVPSALTVPRPIVTNSSR